MQHEQPLQALRDAAHQREWTQIQAVTQALLAELGTFPALEVVMACLHHHLPVFEQYHPPDAPHTPEKASGRVVRELMVSVMSFGFAPERLPDFLPAEFDTPGSGQYVNAVLEMCRAMQKDQLDRFALLTSALANCVLAELAAYWYALHPDAYARVRANRLDPETGEYTDPDAARIPLMFWIDAEVAARDTAAWLRIAEQIARQFATNA